MIRVDGGRLIGRRVIPALIVGLGSLAGPALGSSADIVEESLVATFRPARPGYLFTFPEDHGAHPAFQTEWWYYTGHLKAGDGRRFGYQLTFFRRGLYRGPDGAAPRERSRWRIDDLYFAHLAVADIQGGRFRFADTISREGLGKAGAEEGRLRVWIDRWSVEATDSYHGSHRLIADERDILRAGRTDEAGQGAGIGLTLEVNALKPPVIHGLHGVSRKGAQPEHASHYYSLTRMATSGTLTLDGAPVPVTGDSWMDHEFGSGELSEDLAGWDWFSVQLNSGEELMLYQLRRTDGRPDPASSGTWVDRQGRARHLEADSLHLEVLDHWTSPHTGARYPSRWRVTIPSIEAAFEIIPLLADQELQTPRSTRISYWEGAVDIVGRLGAAPAVGQGYVELTGYAERYRPRR